MIYNTPEHWLTNQVNVALIGCGGTGSEMLDKLVSLHHLLCRLGHQGLNVTVFDPSTVREANLGRQRFWPHHLGENKAEVLVNQHNIYGNLNWRAISDTFSPSRYDVSKFDLIITAVDLPSTRRSIGTQSQSSYGRSVLWLDCGNDTHQAQCVLGHLIQNRKELKLPNTYDLFHQQYASMVDDNSKSCSTEQAIAKQDFGINSAIAEQGIQLLWQLLRKGHIKRHGSWIDIESGIVQPLLIEPEQWLPFGYEPNPVTASPQ